MNPQSSRRQNYRLPRTNTNRGNRARSIDKPITTDGIYANQRFTHAATSLIGCVVQIQVKNRHLFEGILKTFSPKMEIVLECAHRLVDDAKISSDTVSNTPSRDDILDKVIFNVTDIVALTAKNVDLDYAQKDSFTDAAISGTGNMNGDRSDMKELQPWVADGDDDGLGLEGSTANGWDPNEMFKTNREKFNIESTYDSNLSQYTTTIERKDDSEFKRREANAAKLAAEIEGSDNYRRRVALENGDEEEMFSAVIRPTPNKPTSPIENLPDGTLEGGRYVPPHKRRGPHSSGARSGNASPVSHNSPQAQQTNPQSPVTGTGSGSGSGSGSPMANVNGTVADCQPNINGVVQVETVESRSEVKSTAGKVNPEVKSKERKDKDNETTDLPTSNISTATFNSSAGSVLVGAKQKKDIAELKDFKEHFVLSDKGQKEKLSEIPDKSDKSVEKKEVTTAVTANANPTAAAVDETDSDGDKQPTENKKSTLNPNAKEFVFKPKPTPTPTPTPPRPPSQPSPIYQLAIPTNQYQQYMIPFPHGSMPQQKQPRMPIKQVGMALQRPDFNGQNAAAVTGQPLLAQTPTQQYTAVPYHPHMYTQQQAYQPVLQMPTAGQRMLTPQTVGMIPATQSNNDHNNGHHTPNMYVSQPMPAHMTAHPGMPPGPVPQPAHITRPPHSQAVPMNAAGSHPAASPAHQGVGMGGPGPGPPPSSGTPQPQMQHIYQPQGTITMNTQMGQQPQPQGGPGPPLQPSPHTPASPQATHPPNVSFAANYPYNTSQGLPFLTHYTQPHTTMSVNHNPMATTSPHNPGAQTFVMMPTNQQQASGAAPQFQQAPPQIGPGGQLTAPQVQAGNLGGQMIPPGANASQANMHPPIQYFVPHPFQQH